MKRLCLLLLAALVLSACERVNVESVPTGTVIDCDPALTGWWQVTSEHPDADSNEDESMHLFVSADCKRWVSVETDKKASTAKVDDIAGSMTFMIREVADARYLAVSDKDKSPEGKHEIGEGFELIRYVAHHDRIDLFEADPRREAHRVADGLVAGRVESSAQSVGDKHSASSVNTMLTGDGDAIADRLKRFDPIDVAFVELRRVDEKTQKRLEQDLKPVPLAGKPKPHE